MMRRIRSVSLASAVTLASLVASAAANAATPSAGPPRWTVSTVAEPTRFAPGPGQAYQLTVTNVGGEATSGPVTIIDTPPAAGATVSAVYGSASSLEAGAYAKKMATGEAFTGRSVSCPASPPPADVPVECEYAGAVAPGDTLAIVVVVEVTAAEGEAVPANTVAVSGGGAPSAESAGAPTPVVSAAASAATPFGIASQITATSDAQAGGHANFTTSFELDTNAPGTPVADPRTIEVELPAGLVGDAQAAPRCTVGALRTSFACPSDTAVGVATTRLAGGATYVTLVYDVVPYPGEPAAFVFQLGSGVAGVRIDTRVVSNGSAPGGYAVRATIPEINESEPVDSSSVTLWGVPADFNGPGPDEAEGLGKVNGETLEEERVRFGGPSETAGPLAQGFMRNPTSCDGPLTVGLQASPWPDGAFEPADSSVPYPGEGFSGCSTLATLFVPSIEVRPDASSELSPGTFRAGAPSGYGVELTVPQSDSGQQPATPDLRNVKLTLPVGVVASPAAANGLEACSDEQFDQTSTEPAGCPQQSSIGTVRIETPLLEEELTGQLFLGQQTCAQCDAAQAEAGELVRLFLQAQYGSGPHAGEYVRIKLAGLTRIDQRTGQLTTEFDEDPQLPFEVLSLHLKGGPDAPLVNPGSCGTAATSAELAPWSGTAPVDAISSFAVGGCTPSHFAPSFSAGMTSSVHAGSYSPFSLTFARSDADEDLRGITVHTPPGLLGTVSHVTQCDEAQATAGTCPASSEIGSASAAIGAGSQPYLVTGGKAFLTGPYHGDPFGLSIVVPAKAGPFSLAGENGLGQEGGGNVVVRASIAVDPHTSALTITSNPLPQQLDGIPLQVKAVNVDVNRPEFMFNATNCEAMKITAAITSAQGTSAAVSSPYQASDCAALPFQPSFKVETHSFHSRKKGAYLKVSVGYLEGQANIGKVHVTLPKKLPSRLATLNLACTEAQFVADPSGCPEASFVGTATVSTPVLASKLTGPAIFVSHGGAEFPNLDIVLQGEGVTVILEGATHISKSGYTSSTFKTVPDVPVNTFQLTLPEGPHSALSGEGNLCKKPLEMPTTITGQNGVVMTQKTKLHVSGCAKKKTNKNARKDRRERKKSKMNAKGKKG